MSRQAKIKRKTRETEVIVHFDLDGEGQSDIDTGYPFFDHMLELFSWHGFFDLIVKARGDIQVDKHHLVEDVGICLGKAFLESIKDKKGIRRYGHSSVPMDEVLIRCAIDVSGRPTLVLNFKGSEEIRTRIEDPFRDFFKGFCVHSGTTVHINVEYGWGFHHIMEGIFKSFGITLDQATRIDPRREKTPSSKDLIEEI